MSPHTVHRATSHRTRRLPRRLAWVVAIVSTFCALPTGSAQAASPSLWGVVTCSGGRAVQGVWVQSSAGGSRWADWWALPGRSSSAHFSTQLSFSGSSSKVELHVGCGTNSNGSWWSTNLTPAVTITGAKIMNAVCAERAGRATTCSYAPTGKAAATNGGDAGYCTYGAYEQWKTATGYYPTIGGNAGLMDDNAITRGLRVTDVPQPKSMIVFNTGGFGHVGWVTAIRKVGNTVAIDYTDMNGGAWVDKAKGITTDFNKFVARTVTWDPKVQRFIVAPV